MSQSEREGSDPDSSFDISLLSREDSEGDELDTEDRVGNLCFTYWFWCEERIPRELEFHFGEIEGAAEGKNPRGVIEC